MPKEKKNDISNILTKNYVQTLSDIKEKIKSAQIEAATSANEKLTKLYWFIGQWFGQFS